MPVQIIGYVPHSPTALSSGYRDTDAFDIDFIDAAARAHEEAGFDSVLIAHGSSKPDAWQIAAHVAHVTRRLGLLVATRPGFTAPTLVARQAVTLERFAGQGRVAIHIISGGDESEQNRDGDFLEHDERYRRSAEFIEILRKEWRERTPFDFDGRYFKLKGAYSPHKPSGLNAIPICFAGQSGPAVETGAEHADNYIFGSAPLRQTGDSIDAVLKAAARYGRKPLFGVTQRALLAATEAEAWSKTEEILARAEREIAAGKPISAGKAQSASSTFTSVGHRKLQEIANSGDVHDERLWLGYARLLGGGGTNSALVGTPAQVAAALMRYYDIGVRLFYLRGWDILGEAKEYGKELIPLFRKLVAEREAVRLPSSDPIVQTSPIVQTRAMA